MTTDKAKEIIKKFLDANSDLDMISAQRKAEQFLKEMENYEMQNL